MKKIGALFIFIIGLNSCSEEEQLPDASNIQGTWKLTEELLDPGDGSGVFVSVSSGKTIEFFANGSYVSNGAICAMSSESNQESTGSYDIENQTILPEKCAGTNEFNISYSLESSYLILSFPCIEPCRQKYIKVAE